MGKKQSSVKKCSLCGVIVDSYSYGHFCKSCAREVWDRGFESTTQHAEEIYEKDLEEKEEINKEINKAKINSTAVRKLVNYKSGTFRCSKCKKLRMKWAHFEPPLEDEQKLRDILIKPCPKCNVTGYLTFK